MRANNVILALIAIVVLVAAIVLAIVVVRIVYAVRITTDRAWLKGFGAPFIASLGPKSSRF